MVKGSKMTEEQKAKIGKSVSLEERKLKKSSLDEDLLDLEVASKEKIAKHFHKILTKCLPNIKTAKYRDFFEPFMKSYAKNPINFTWSRLAACMITYSAFYSYCDINVNEISKLTLTEQRDLLRVKEIINAYLDQKAMITPSNGAYIQYMKNSDQPDRFWVIARTKSISDKLQKEVDKSNKDENNSNIEVDLSGFNTKN